MKHARLIFNTKDQLQWNPWLVSHQYSRNQSLTQYLPGGKRLLSDEQAFRYDHQEI
jgi:hypothetical protein